MTKKVSKSQSKKTGNVIKRKKVTDVEELINLVSKQISGKNWKSHIDWYNIFEKAYYKVIHEYFNFTIKEDFESWKALLGSSIGIWGVGVHVFKLDCIAGVTHLWLIAEKAVFKYVEKELMARHGLVESYLAGPPSCYSHDDMDNRRKEIIKSEKRDDN